MKKLLIKTIKPKKQGQRVFFSSKQKEDHPTKKRKVYNEDINK